MRREVRALRVTFERAEEFRREFEANLSNGGVFVATEEPLALREPVRVELVLAFCGKSIELEAEVVHLVPAEMAGIGATPGAALQLQQSAAEVRRHLERLAGDAVPPLETESGRRRAPRRQARVRARIADGEGAVEGRTRDLSHSGVLVNVDDPRFGVGQTVELALENPSNGQSMRVAGRVVREVERDGEVAALALQFEPADEQRGEFERFVEGVQNAEHARRLGGISGGIAELGPQSLVQMFGTAATSGTLTLRCDDQEGVLGFEAGLLRYARLGNASGMKALTRLLAWSEGSFEFHARLDPGDGAEAPLPLEAAVLDAVRRLDELTQIDCARFPGDARLAIASEACDAPSKVESAVLDLARAGYTVRRIVEFIPEPDPQIYRTFESLEDRGIVRVEK